METRQGKIEKKSLAYARNKAPYATFTIDGKNYNTFDNDIADNFQPDEFVEFTGEVNSKGFWELKTMKKIDVPIGETVELKHDYDTNKDRGFHLSPEEVKCRALESAIKNQHSVEYDELDLLKIADKFVEWIYGS